MWTSLKSKEDSSINFHYVEEDGLIETRFVQRSDDYFIVYLSSHNGCNQSCRFCHLTATGQTSFSSVTPYIYRMQASKIISQRVLSASKASVVHFNFMARGEPLLNPYLVKDPWLVYDVLKSEVKLSGVGRPPLHSKFLISTILPKAFPAFKQKLSDVLSDPESYLYYSLYSVNPAFRKKWLPKAMEPSQALDLIAEYQETTKKQITLHWAFIENHNDSVEDLHQTLGAVVSRGIDAKFNLVRYNPYSEKQGKEANDTRISELFDVVNEYFPQSPNKIVSRVGFDVKASCGMFLEK